jgi:NADH-quinone oxidoreductase subunit N
LISFCCFSTFSIKAFSFYFLFYVIMNLVLFSIVVISFSKQNFLKYLINWADTAKRNYILIIAFTTVLFSTAGIPPLAGFYSKLLVFFSLIQQNYLVLTIIITLFSCVGCYFYIRLIKTFFFQNKNSAIWVLNKSKMPELIISTKTLFLVIFLMVPDTALYLTDLVSFFL